MYRSLNLTYIYSFMIKSYKGNGLFIFVIVAAIFIISFVLFIIYGSKRSTEGMSIILNHETKSEDIYGENVNKDGYLDGIDVIYYINLDRSVDRRNHMERIFKDSVFDDISVMRFPAYDGKKIEMRKYFVIDNIGTKDTSTVSNSEYACLMSHLETIRTFSESSYDIALILEDDITLEYKKYWEKTMRRIIDNAPRDWDIIQLATIFDNIEDLNYITNKEYTLNSNNDKNEKLWSTAAYIINKDAAIKLMKNIYRNGKYHINNLYYHVSDILIYTVLKTYVYEKPYFTYITDNTSTIHQNHVAGHIQSKNLVTNYLNSIFSRYTNISNPSDRGGSPIVIKSR
jgi:GR25 family glycosyltransferase involved in LPS biosynthesis